MISPRTSRILAFLSIFCLVYWLLAHQVNAYRYAWSGAFFELTALPTIAMAFGLFAAYLYFLLRKKMLLKGWNLLGFAALMGLFLFLASFG